MNSASDRELIAVVETSAVIRAAARAADAWSAAARNSVAVTRFAAARAAWLRHSAVDRTRATGIALVTAALVYLALIWWHGPIAGWLWLVPPALTVAFGAVMSLAPSRGLVRESSR